MQRAEQAFFAERSIFYICRLVSKGLERGNENYDLPTVIGLCITEHTLPQFADMEPQDLSQEDEVFRSVFEDSMHQKLTNMEKEDYKKSVLEYKDVQAAVQYAREQGEKLGYDSGFGSGYDSGVEHGIKQGIKQGYADATTGLFKECVLEYS